MVDVAQEGADAGRGRSRSSRRLAARRAASLLGHVGTLARVPNTRTHDAAPPRPATYADEVLRWPACVLSDEQRREYFEHGCLLLPGFISAEWVQKLRALVHQYVEKSKSLSKSTVASGLPLAGETKFDKYFILGEGHSSERPEVVRIVSPVELHDTFWEFATGPIADVAQDLLGPDVRLHHSKLNFKMGGAPNTKTKRHQGPMDVVPLSAYDELHPLEDAKGNWTGVLAPEVLKEVPWEQARCMKGPVGTLTVHNARCVHGGRANTTLRDRLLLLHTFAAATAHPLDAGSNPLHRKSKHGMPMVRGRATNFAVFDPRPCPMAPSFEAGYTPPFFGDKEDKPLMDG